MRIILLTILLLLSFQPIFADDQTSSVPDSIRIERIAGLCELWGVVKYFHPYLAYKDIDWDEALIKTIPRVNKAETAEDYRRAVQYLISFLQDPNTYVVDPMRDLILFHEWPFDWGKTLLSIFPFAFGSLIICLVLAGRHLRQT